MRELINAVSFVLLCGFALAFAGGFYFGTNYTDNKIGVDMLQKKADSLHAENFMLNVELSRWETTIEWYREDSPAEAKKLEDWRSHNTE